MLEKVKKNEVEVSEEIVNKIEALQYEVSARKELVAHMLANGYSTESDSYQRYHKEYMKFYGELEDAKEALAVEYVYPETNGKRVDWNLDFKTHIVTF